ncbi:MAG: hypothetical protein QW707_06885, partial [Candidatus Bathyarchaeia archaeon]
VKVLKVELDHNLAKDFEKVRAYLGIKNDSEVIRFLIREKAREIPVGSCGQICPQHEGVE